MSNPVNLSSELFIVFLKINFKYFDKSSKMLIIFGNEISVN